MTSQVGITGSSCIHSPFLGRLETHGISGTLQPGEGWHFLWPGEGGALGSGLTVAEGRRWAWAPRDLDAPPAPRLPAWSHGLATPTLVYAGPAVHALWPLPLCSLSLWQWGPYLRLSIPRLLGDQEAGNEGSILCPWPCSSLSPRPPLPPLRLLAFWEDREF